MIRETRSSRGSYFFSKTEGSILSQLRNRIKNVKSQSRTDLMESIPRDGTVIQSEQELLGRKAINVRKVYSVDPSYKIGWIVDCDVKCCMVCWEDFIFFTRSRHHCRVCGLLVCAKCSPYKTFIGAFEVEEPGGSRACSKCSRHDVNKSSSRSFTDSNTSSANSPDDLIGSAGSTPFAPNHVRSRHSRRNDGKSEYNKILDQIEEFEKQQRPKYLASYRTMRRLVPPDITKTDLGRMRSQGLPEVVAQRLWNTKSLWLICMHKEDIFKIHKADLRGKYNFHGLDLTEMRAVWHSLPDWGEVLEQVKYDWKEGFKMKMDDMAYREAKGTLQAAEIRHPVYEGTQDLKIYDPDLAIAKRYDRSASIHSESIESPVPAGSRGSARGRKSAAPSHMASSLSALDKGTSQLSHHQQYQLHNEQQQLLRLEHHAVAPARRSLGGMGEAYGGDYHSSSSAQAHGDGEEEEDSLEDNSLTPMSAMLLAMKSSVSKTVKDMLQQGDGTCSLITEHQLEHAATATASTTATSSSSSSSISSVPVRGSASSALSATHSDTHETPPPSRIFRSNSARSASATSSNTSPDLSLRQTSDDNQIGIARPKSAQPKVQSPLFRSSAVSRPAAAASDSAGAVDSGAPPVAVTSNDNVKLRVSFGQQATATSSSSIASSASFATAAAPRLVPLRPKLTTATTLSTQSSSSSLPAEVQDTPHKAVNDSTSSDPWHWDTPSPPPPHAVQSYAVRHLSTARLQPRLALNAIHNQPTSSESLDVDNARDVRDNLVISKVLPGSPKQGSECALRHSIDRCEDSNTFEETEHNEDFNHNAIQQEYGFEGNDNDCGDVDDDNDDEMALEEEIDHWEQPTVLDMDLIDCSEYMVEEEGEAEEVLVDCEGDDEGVDNFNAQESARGMAPRLNSHMYRGGPMGTPGSADSVSSIDINSPQAFNFSLSACDINRDLNMSAECEAEGGAGEEVHAYFEYESPQHDVRDRKRLDASSFSSSLAESPTLPAQHLPKKNLVPFSNFNNRTTYESSMGRQTINHAYKSGSTSKSAPAHITPLHSSSDVTALIALIEAGEAAKALERLEEEDCDDSVHCNDTRAAGRWRSLIKPNEASHLLLKCVDYPDKLVQPLATVKLLVEKLGADVNAADVTGRSALLASFNQEAIGKYLMSKGADALQEDNVGTCALSMSLDYGLHWLLKEMLTKGVEKKLLQSHDIIAVKKYVTCLIVGGMCTAAKAILDLELVSYTSVEACELLAKCQENFDNMKEPIETFELLDKLGGTASL